MFVEYNCNGNSEQYAGLWKLADGITFIRLENQDNTANGVGSLDIHSSTPEG